MPYTIIQRGARYPAWVGRIEGVKALLTDEDLPDAAVVALATKAVAVLKASKPSPLGRNAADEYVAVIEEFESVTDERDFNEALDRLYDFGDDNRIIIA